jgi:NAD+ kinase
MRIGLFFNQELEAGAAVADAVRSASYGDIDVSFAAGDATSDHGTLDLAVSIGGDGTFLLTSKTIMGMNIPLYGINTGRLGFLASGDAESAVNDMRLIIAGKYKLLPKIPIRGEISRDGHIIERVCAFNEIMILKNMVSRPIALSAHIGNEKLYNFLADGIIVSTPTGSTAYALSAGGPIVHPGVRCVTIIPVCPHSLSPRPMVVPDTETVRIKVDPSPCGAILSADGQNNVTLASGDEALITADIDKKIDVVTLGGSSYVDMLRNKLNW